MMPKSVKVSKPGSDFRLLHCFWGPLGSSAVQKVPETASETLAETKTVKTLRAALNAEKCSFNNNRDQICVLSLPSQTVYLWCDPAPSSHMDAMDPYTCGLAGCQLMTAETEPGT